MALLWVEGFDSFGTTVNAAPSPSGVVARKYSAAGEEARMKVKSGRLGGYALQLVYDSTCNLVPAALTTHDTLVLGCAVRFDGVFPNLKTFAGFYDGTTLGMNLYMLSSGEVQIRRGTTVLATTSGLGLVTGSWAYLEFKVKCHGTAGTYELRINGETKAIASGVNTKAGTNNYHTTFRLFGTSVATDGAVIFDDLYCLDGSGTVNNDFLGNQRVVTLRPNAAGNSTQFTPDSGENYARVNEVVCGDDSNYVEDATGGHKDLYHYGAVSGLGTITGVMVSTDCRETDAQTFNLVTVCKSGATESDDAGQVIGSTTYVTKRRILDTDPNTGVAWEAAGLNAAQFGVKVG